MTKPQQILSAAVFLRPHAYKQEFLTLKSPL